MNQVNHLLRVENNWETLNNCLQKLNKGKGSIICISGEAGMGKTHLLNEFETHIKRKSNYNVVSVSCQAPIGKFKVGNIQPLQPFENVIERLLSKTDVSAEKKFALNVGMTVLSAIPLAGDVIFAVKEFGRDWRQFKNDKSSSVQTKKISTATADFYDTIRTYTDKASLAILIDDFHWADAQSFELIQLLADTINEYPLLVIFTYRNSLVESQASPLDTFLKSQSKDSLNIYQIELEPFSQMEIRDLCLAYFPKYKDNVTFENWIYEHSYGVPSVIIEYIKYFQKNSPFREDGSLVEDFDKSQYLPTSVHSAFSSVLETLAEEEVNTLSVCSAEGREFTAFIVSHLLNTDVISAIKKLRSLQNKTGIIKSIGAVNKYGIKTTGYKFTQAFYHSHFENILEYEEHIALHGQIASILKEKFEDTESEGVKNQIAPYLAAHSSESGDDITTKSMLLIAAKNAQAYGNSQMVQDVYEDYIHREERNQVKDEYSADNIEFKQIIRNFEKADRENAYSGNSSDYGLEEDFIDNNTFLMFRSSILNDYHNDDYSKALEKAEAYYESYKQGLGLIEYAQIVSFIIICSIETGDYEKAANYSRMGMDYIEQSDDSIAISIILNATAILKSAQGKSNEAMELLSKAAQKSIILPDELKLLTLSNIAILTQKYSPEKSKKYIESVKKLTDKLKYNDLEADIMRK